MQAWRMPLRAISRHGFAALRIELGATSIMPPCLHLPLQGVRSLCRFFLLFFMPVFFGPYWSWVHVQTNFAFAFFFSILVRVDRGCAAANLMCCGCKCLTQCCCTGVSMQVLSPAAADAVYPCAAANRGHRPGQRYHCAGRYGRRQQAVLTVCLLGLRLFGGN